MDLLNSYLLPTSTLFYRRCAKTIADDLWLSQIKTLMHVLLKGFSKDLSPYYLDKFICVLEKRTAVAAYVQIMMA